MASWNVTYEKQRKFKAEWKNDFPSAKWVVIDGIESAHCKLCTKPFLSSEKNIEISCVICGAQAQSKCD